MAIVVAFGSWRHHLEGAKYPVQVITDHKNLFYLKKPQSLNQRQIRWSLFLSKFDFRISYRPGSKNCKPDSLSRRPDYRPINYEPSQKILKDEVFYCVIDDNKIKYLIELQEKDKFCSDIIKRLNSENGELIQ